MSRDNLEVPSKEQPLQGSPSKISLNFPSQVNSYENDDPTLPVTVYLYIQQKKSIKVELTAKVAMSEIKGIVEQRMAIRRDLQIIYLNGKNVTEYGNIRLQNSNILHVSSSEQLCNRNEQIDIRLTIMNFLAKNTAKTIKRYSVAASDTVGEFMTQIEKELRETESIENPEANMYLLESSRLLEKDKSFVDQDLMKQAEIICMITEN